MTNLFNELRRRNVFRVAIAYVVIAWIILQVGETLAPALHLPEWVDSLLAFFLILGFPLALFFAWAFELTPEGLKKEREVDRTESITNVTGRKIDRTIIALLVVALGYFIWSSNDDTAPAVAEQSAAEQGTMVGRTAGGIDVGSLVARQQAADQSIAVLPFINMSSDEEQEYFSDGLSEELLNLLAKIPALRVASRTSAFSYKGKDITIPQVGRELNVAHILEGSVRASGSTIRITAQLIDVENDAHLWSETWDRTLEDVFAIQDEIAKAVVDQLRIELLGAAPHVVETSPEVYAALLQARHHSRSRTYAGVRAAEKLLEGAIAIDPNYAPAWAALGATYMGAAGFDAERGALPLTKLAREAVEKALALDPENTLAIAVLANLALVRDYDNEAAIEYLERGLAINPNDANLLNMAAGTAFVLGDYKTGKKLGRQMQLVDPLSVSAHFNFGYSAYFSGDYDDAIDAFERVLALNPDAAGPHYYIACVLWKQGRYEEALLRADRENLDGFEYTAKAMVHFSLGDQEASDAALAALNELDVNWAYQRVMIYAIRGELDKAFDWIDTAIEIGDRGLNLTVGDPALDNLRSDPRFARVLERLNRTPIYPR